MTTSRTKLALYFGQHIQIDALLTAQQRGRLTLLQDIRQGKLSLCQHLWVVLPPHDYPPHQYVHLEGVVGKYLRFDDSTEDYTLQKVRFR